MYLEGMGFIGYDSSINFFNTFIKRIINIGENYYK